MFVPGEAEAVRMPLALRLDRYWGAGVGLVVVDFLTGDLVPAEGLAIECAAPACTILM
jgi:hypothetical protein